MTPPPPSAPAAAGNPPAGASGGPWPRSAPADRARAALAVLLVVCGSAVVALAAGGFGLLRPPAGADEAWLDGVRLGGGVAALLGVAALFVRSRRVGRTGRPGGPGPAATTVLAASLVLLALALLSLLAPPRPSGAGAGSGASPPGGGTIDPSAETVGPPPPPARNAPVTRGIDEGGVGVEPDWRVLEEAPAEVPTRDGPDRAFDPALLGRLVRLLLLLLLGAGVFAAFLAGRGRPPRPARSDAGRGGLAAADAEAGLNASLDELAGRSGDPRGRVTTAYHRLLEAFAVAGAPRYPHEAPREYLSRVLGPLGVPPDPVRRLTELYLFAQFSDHPVTEEHRARAASALVESLRGLPDGAPPPEGARAPEEGPAWTSAT